MFGRANIVLLPKYKIIFSESDGSDIPAIPSERTIAVQNDIARDEHVNDLGTNSSIDSLVKSDEVIKDSSCDEHVTDDIIDLSCDSLAKADAEVAAINGVCTCSECLNIDDEPLEISCDHLDYDITTESTRESHVDTDDECSTTNAEQLPAFIRVPPNKLELCETDFGKTGLIVDPEYWHWLDLPHSSQENLASDDDGTTSTGREGSYDMGNDVASRVASNSFCYSPVPEEMTFCLSCGGDPVNTDNGGDRFNHTPSGNSVYDELFESDLEYGDIHSGYRHNGSGNFYLTPTPTSSVHSEQQEWILDCSDMDSYKYTGCISNVSGGDKSLNNSLNDPGVIWEGLDELTSAVSVAISKVVYQLGWYKLSVNTLFHHY